MRAVEARYGFPVAVLRPLTGGYANDVFLVDSPRGSLVLRRKHPPSDPAGIEWEHELVARLAAELPEVPAPVEALDGSTFFLYEGDAVSLVPALAGRPASRRDRRHRIAAAALLGRLHRLTAALELPPRPGIAGLAEVRTLAADRLPRGWRRRVAEHGVEALALFERVAAREPASGVLHGDFFPGNVIARDGRIVGLVDWEEAHPGWLATELANAGWEFCRTPAGDDLERNELRRFVDAYRDAGGPPDEAEDDLLLPLIRIKRILEVLRAPTDRHVDWAYQERNRRAFERLG